MNDQTTNIFSTGIITAFPTNTSFGLGVRADDNVMLKKMNDLKNRPKGKFFSLIVKDWAMLKKFAEVPKDLSSDFFTQKPRTIILKPTNKLPKSLYWPIDKVAFRISTIQAVQKAIKYPVTATSANLSGELPIYDVQTLKINFGSQIKIFSGFERLPVVESSEIWDYTGEQVVQVR